MENKKFMIDKIPAVRYGEASDRCFLYIHGKMGFKEEAESDQVNEYFEQAGKVSLTKTHGRSPVATLNKMIEYLGFLPMVMDSGELYQALHCHEVNRDYLKRGRSG